MGNNGIDKVNSSDDYLGISGRQQLCPKERVQLGITLCMSVITF